MATYDDFKTASPHDAPEAVAAIRAQEAIDYERGQLRDMLQAVFASNANGNPVKAYYTPYHEGDSEFEFEVRGIESVGDMVGTLRELYRRAWEWERDHERK